MDYLESSYSDLALILKHRLKTSNKVGVMGVAEGGSGDNVSVEVHNAWNGGNDNMK